MNSNESRNLYFGVDPLEFKDTNKNIGEDIITLEESVEKLFGEKIIKKDGKVEIKAHISSTQLRSLYDKIKQCKSLEQIKIMYPRVLYVAARQGKDKGKVIVIEIAKIIKRINSWDDFKAFKMFMEAVLSYQKYYYPTKN